MSTSLFQSLDVSLLQARASAMGQPTKAKLLKLVCKQAGIVRNQFKTVSWKNKDVSLVKKHATQNKPGDRFRRKIAKLSCDKTWPHIRKVNIIKII